MYFEQYCGVIGIFNCQGAGWDKEKHVFRGFPECYKAVCGTIHVSDIEWEQNKEGGDIGKAEEYLVYMNQTEKLFVMSPESEPFQITLQPSTMEILSFIPVKNLKDGVKFAPIGLTNMFNNGGTIEELDYVDDGAKLKVKGGGTFLAYSTHIPSKCLLNGADVAFEWMRIPLPHATLKINLAWNEDAGGVSDLAIFY